MTRAIIYITDLPDGNLEIQVESVPEDLPDDEEMPQSWALSYLLLQFADQVLLLESEPSLEGEMPEESDDPDELPPRKLIR